MISFFPPKRRPITRLEVTEWPYRKVKYHFKSFSGSLEHYFKKKIKAQKQRTEKKREKKNRDIEVEKQRCKCPCLVIYRCGN